MIKWLSKNKEWVFSGIGIFIITTLASFVLKTQQNNSQEAKQNTIAKDNSTVITAEGQSTVVQVPGSSGNIHVYNNSEASNSSKSLNSKSIKVRDLYPELDKYFTLGIFIY